MGSLLPSGAQLTAEFAEIHWKPDALARFGLPDLGYPVPHDLLPEIVDSGGVVPFADQLYWLQDYSSLNPNSWQALEPAMLRLAELIAPSDERDAVTVAGDSWFLELKSVDLNSPCVTVQRGNSLVAALQCRSDGRLVGSAYRPLDAKSVQLIIGLSLNPNAKGEVCLRPTNWEYALDQASQTTAAWYASERGESYLSLWSNGLGLVADGTTNEVFLAQREARPLSPHLTALQLGVYYQRAPNSSI